MSDKNASGLQDIKSCHFRWMQASVTRQASIPPKNVDIRHDIVIFLVFCSLSARTAAGN